MVNLKWSIYTHLVSIFFIRSIGDKLKYYLFRQLFFQLNFECPDTWTSTFEGTEHVVLRIQMSKDDFLAKWYIFSSFLTNYRFKLLLLSFGSWRRLRLFSLRLLRVHFIIDLKGASWKYFEKRLPVVIDIHDIIVASWEHIVLVVDLKIDILVSIAKWWECYDLLVMKVLAFS